ncbi:MAG: UPF0149 family protein [Pseudomonas sp.]|nr:UPF0149 family protein [Pseudomonas sp.]
MSITLSSEPLNDDQLDFIQEALERYPSEQSVRTVSELDGFFTAIVSGPIAIQFSDWYAALWGGAGYLPKWNSEKEFERFMNLLIQHMNHLATVLEEDQTQYEPIFSEIFDDEEQTSQLSVGDWCLGYERGVDMGGGWNGLPDDEQDLLAFVTIHTLNEEDLQGTELPDEDIEDTIDQLHGIAIALHAYWLQRRAAPQPARAEVRAGRNDPCPCGSGKKYKQCCLH